jgi:ketosteroid isomerase-like protein
MLSHSSLLARLPADQLFRGAGHQVDVLHDDRNRGMMTASTPADCVAAAAAAITAGDIDAVLSYYEADAVLTPAGQPETSEIRGHDALRTVFASWAGTDPRLTVDTQTVIEAGDIALVLGSWTLTMNGPDGILDLAGTYSDVVRRQSDGSWLYVIDRPTMG